MLRENRGQGSYGGSQQRADHRHMYSSFDDVFSEEKLPSRTTQDHLVENDAARCLKQNDHSENRKERARETESCERVETQTPSKSTREEKSQPPLSTYHSVNAPMGSARVSASLPRNYQKTDTARLTSVVTPRPFSVHSRGISSLPRSFTVKPASFSSLKLLHR